ncbi:family 8 glycosyltransferase [Cladorrhinum sp. PSN259]|nr:family 8 glycosyltransferase [Cladorrhinum sp. PSN259]
MSDGTRAANSDKVWTTLITSLSYLPGLLTLHYSLIQKHKSKYPLIALYTDAFPSLGLDALHARSIPTQHIKTILPASSKPYSQDPRFTDCWTKLVPFSLTQYARVVQLDSDMLVLQNMDELFDLPLDPSSDRVFAAGHACVCNPLGKPHYPPSWIPENCAFTAQALQDPDLAQKSGGDPRQLSPEPSYCNGGLQVVQPSLEHWSQILEYMNSHASELDFADQSVLSKVFKGRWVAVPYVYNALKTLRWEGVHDTLWRDEEIKNLHFILTPKPWEEEESRDADETHKWWKTVDRERKEWERQSLRISDGWCRDS